MQQAGIDANHERGAGNQPRHPVERRAVGHARARRGRGDPRRTLALGLGAERHHEIDARAQRRREHPPVRLRPFLVGARGRVQQHAIGRA